MRRSLVSIAVLGLACSMTVLAGASYRLADTWPEPDIERHKLTKILVIGISGDREVRHRFEDKFAAHLRGRGIAAVTSHSLVPELTSLPDRDRVLALIEQEAVDGVMTVRAVPVGQDGEADWVAAWEAWVDAPSTPRELIEQSLPVPAQKSKRFGIELSLWDVRTPQRLWSARTDVHTLKELRAGVGDLLQLTIDALRDARWLKP